jgi:hypothetical protein
MARPKKDSPLSPEFLALLTDNLDPETAAEMQAELQEVAETVQNKDFQQAQIREANAVLLSLNNITTVVMRKCPECKEKFQTNYKYSKYCSNTCLKEALRKRGLTWHPEKSAEERWKGEPPSTISPQTLKVLVRWARAILQEYEASIDSILNENLPLQTETLESDDHTDYSSESPQVPTGQEIQSSEDAEFDRWLRELF